MPEGYLGSPSEGVGKRIEAWEKPGSPSEYVYATRNDFTLNATPKRYMISITLTGSITAGTNLGGLRKLNANSDVYITFINCEIVTGAANTAINLAPIAFKRASSVAAGSQITAADIPELDSATGAANLEVRTGAVTGTKANQPIWIPGFYAPNIGAGGAAIWHGGSGAQYVATIETGMRWRLTADEGIIIEQYLAGLANNRYIVTIQWEEV